MKSAYVNGATLLALASALPALAAVPSRASAQVELGFHYSRNDALPTQPHLGGLSLGSYAGPIGVRLNGGLNIVEREPADPARSSSWSVGAWSADADLIFAPLRASRGLRNAFLGFSPFVFVGIGGQGLRLPNLPDTSFATWSYGAGVSHNLAGPVGAMADARYRKPLERIGSLPSDYADEWEFRAGLTIAFGGHKDRRRPVRHPDYHPPRRGRVAHPGHDRVSESRNLSGAALVVDAERYIGTKYRYGGSSPDQGFDCSGLVQYVYGGMGVPLPRTARAMSEVGEKLEPDPSNLSRGDLLFFAGDGRHIDHVAIYAGGDRIIHSTASGGGVRFDELSSPRGKWFADRLVAARRVVEDGRILVSASASYGPVQDTELDPPDRAPLPPR